MKRYGNNTQKKYYLLREIVTIYKKAKPLLLETEMATCKNHIQDSELLKGGEGVGNFDFVARYKLRCIVKVMLY